MNRIEPVHHATVYNYRVHGVLVLNRKGNILQDRWGIHSYMKCIHRYGSFNSISILYIYMNCSNLKLKLYKSSTVCLFRFNRIDSGLCG